MSIILMICLLSVFLLFVISISPEKLLEFRQCPCQHLCLFFVHAIKHFHDHLLVEHPMMEKHYIQWILIETNFGTHCRSLTPEDKPEAEFFLADGEKLIAVYEYCNLHGLWKAEA